MSMDARMETPCGNTPLAAAGQTCEQRGSTWLRAMACAIGIAIALAAALPFAAWSGTDVAPAGETQGSETTAGKTAEAGEPAAETRAERASPDAGVISHAIATALGADSAEAEDADELAAGIATANANDEIAFEAVVKTADRAESRVFIATPQEDDSIVIRDAESDEDVTILEADLDEAGGVRSWVDTAAARPASAEAPADALPASQAVSTAEAPDEPTEDEVDPPRESKDADVPESDGKADAPADAAGNADEHAASTDDPDTAESPAEDETDGASKDAAKTARTAGDTIVDAGQAAPSSAPSPAPSASPEAAGGTSGGKQLLKTADDAGTLAVLAATVCLAAASLWAYAAYRRRQSAYRPW